MTKPLPVLTPPGGAAGRLHLSGILVRTPPARLQAVVDGLERLPGVEVHRRDRPSGKIVITHEAASRQEAEAGLRRIRSLPGVQLAEPVYHYVDPDPEPGRGDDGGDRS